MKMKYSKEIRRQLRGLPPKKHKRKLSEEVKNDIKTFFALFIMVFGFLGACLIYITM